jgi:hypothetical protein
MNELPLLFSGPMVRAINADIKTMTRRTRGLDRVNADPAAWIHIGIYLWPGKDRISATFQNRETGEIIDIKSPYGNPGDRLWVRENFGYSHQEDDINGKERVVCYQAGHPFHITDANVKHLKICQCGVLMQPNHYVRKPDKWRPSIHMPRWASRTDLDIVSICIERLMDITEPAAISEGVEVIPNAGVSYVDYTGRYVCHISAVHSFWSLWEFINGHESLDLNPWVWVIGFRRVKP